MSSSFATFTLRREVLRAAYAFAVAADVHVPGDPTQETRDRVRSLRRLRGPLTACYNNEGESYSTVRELSAAAEVRQQLTSNSNRSTIPP